MAQPSRDCLCHHGLIRVWSTLRSGCRLSQAPNSTTSASASACSKPGISTSSSSRCRSPTPAAAAKASEGGTAGERPPALSKGQLRKIAAREIRQQKKGQKKFQRQADALGSALSTLQAAFGDLLDHPCKDQDELRASLRDTFGVAENYGQLLAAHGPIPTEGIPVMGSALVRPPKYNSKFLPQEYSLVHKVWALLGGDCEGTGVVDVGAGNANCAVLIATLLGMTVICVEKESPREELRAEAHMPEALRRRVLRLESDIEDFTAAKLEEVALAHGLRRVVLLAKHPCGIGADRTIECADRLSKVVSASLSIVGAVMATCCANKLCSDDAHVPHVAEFCGYYRAACRCPQGAGAGAGLERVVDVMSRCSAWRTASESEGNAIGPEQVAWAELFEDGLQALRIQRLCDIFGAATQVRFAPRECTLQDRCLLAGAPPLPSELWAHGENTAAFTTQLRQAAEALCASSGPIDCRPKGLQSLKYDFDYTNGVPE